MDHDDLIQKVATDLFGYAMSGELSYDEIAGFVRPADLDDRYNSYDRLVDLHFVLSEDVTSFVASLPHRIRELKTETRSQTQITREAIKGKIDWNATYQQRYNRGGSDRSLFVCSQRESERAIPENLLLVFVLDIIRDALEEASEYFVDGSNWLTATWEGDDHLRQQFFHLLDHNVHLQELPIPDQHAIDTQIVRAAETARKSLYTDAASLYRQHRAYRDGDEDVLRELLESTAIVPDDPTLFELYVLFESVRSLEKCSSSQDDLRNVVGHPSINTLKSGRGPVATFDGLREFHIFYDQGGGELDIAFQPYSNVDPEDFSREDAATVYSRQTANAYFTSSDEKNRTKRPDVLIVAKNPSSDSTANHIVIEVKDSTDEDYIRQGIRELHEYLVYMSQGKSPIFDTRGYLGGGTNGILVIQDLPNNSETLPVEQQVHLPITILQASEVETNLPEILADTITRG